jgi:hypothetical protein
MINTLSLCPTCYQKIPAQIQFQNGLVVMSKVCPAHGPFSAIMEKDIQHFSNFYSEGTLGNNNTIIIHTHGNCNMSCPWCYFPMGQIPDKPADYFNMVLGQYRGWNLLMSGGEPTIRPDFFEFTERMAGMGWPMAAITNMLRLGDREFFQRTLESPLAEGGMLKFAMSMQHPKNYPEAILRQKIAAINNIEMAGKRVMCVMFSIQSLDELDYIRDFYDATKSMYGMLRIRAMFGNWKNKGGEKVWLSDLHKAFLWKFSDLMPKISRRTEQSNIYCLYMEMKGGMEVSLSSAPTVENLDYHQCSRPVYMLAEDGRCYPVPICQIISEGVERGWKDGYKLVQGGE